MVCATRIGKDGRVKKTDRIQIQGHARNGWDIEDIHSMHDVHAFFNTKHYGKINVWVNSSFIGHLPNLGKKMSYEEYLYYESVDCEYDYE